MLNPSIITRQWTVNIQQGTHPQHSKLNAQQCLLLLFFRFKIDWNAYTNGKPIKAANDKLKLIFSCRFKAFCCYCLQEKWQQGCIWGGGSVMIAPYCKYWQYWKTSELHLSGTLFGHAAESFNWWHFLSLKTSMYIILNFLPTEWYLFSATVCKRNC